MRKKQAGMWKQTTIVTAAVAMLALAGTLWAAVMAVTSKPVYKAVRPGQDVTFVLDLDSATSVAGVNGEMRYDAGLLSQPRVAAGSGASGFMVMGHVTEPGRFRFVAYKSPSATVDLAKAALNFTLRVDRAPAARTTNLTYSLSAASKIDGLSYGGSVRFADVKLDFLTAAQNWSHY